MGVSADGRARLLEAVALVTGEPAVGFRYTPGGWSVSVRGVVELAGGRRVFAKLGDVPDTAGAIRAEIGVYRLLGSRRFLPALVGADPEAPVLIVENLEDATWPPPWSESLLRAFDELCDELAGTPAPAGLPALADDVAEDGWVRVAADPGVTAEILDGDWLDRRLPTLLAAQRQARADGGSLVHTDLRSDNLAFRDGRAIAVDWNLARRGDARWDPHLTAHTIHMEGGGPLERILPDPDPGIITWLAGFFAARAGLPPPEGAPRVRTFQLAQLRVVLPWACRLLGLAAPPPPQYGPPVRTGTLPRRL